MKVIQGIIIVFLALFAAATPSQIQNVVSLQFGGTINQISANSKSGVIASSNWNFVGGGFVSPTTLSGSNLRDRNGAVTGIGYTLVCEGTGYPTNYPGGEEPGFARGTGDYALYMGGANGSFISTNPVTLTLSGLDATHRYNLIANVSYVNSRIPTDVALTAGSVTYYMNTGNPPLRGYIQGAATDTGSATVANYVEFTNLTGSDSLALTIQGLEGARRNFVLNGVQLVDFGAVSEPETLVKLSAAVLKSYIRSNADTANPDAVNGQRK